jgi:hypothetical protein
MTKGFDERRLLQLCWQRSRGSIQCLLQGHSLAPQTLECANVERAFERGRVDRSLQAGETSHLIQPCDVVLRHPALETPPVTTSDGRTRP